MWIRTLISWAALVACTAASAAVTVLDASTEHARVNDHFSTIRIAITDDRGAPVARAMVQAQLYSYLSIDGFTCAREGIYYCTWSAGNDGIVVIDGIKASQAGTYPIVFQSASGYVTVTLIADPLGPAGSLTVLSGGDQRAALGQPFAKPLVVRATHADGTPIVGRAVAFENAYRIDARDDFFGSHLPSAYIPVIGAIMTDANGVATSPAFIGTNGIGLGYVQATLFEDETATSLRVRAPFHNTTKDGAETVALQDLWWGGPAENGWGLAVMQHGTDVYPILFTYDDAGKPTWRAATGDWYAGLASSFDARYFSTVGSPFFAYDPARVAIAERPGALYLGFDDAATDHMRFSLQPDGKPAIEKTLHRQDITGPRAAPLQGLGDLWWGGEKQNGWGLALIEQPGGLVSIWFTYDALGAPTWFIMPNGTWTDDASYTGAIYRTTGMPLGPGYDPSRFHVEVAGEFTFRFADTSHATFEYRVDDKSGSVPITREPF